MQGWKGQFPQPQRSPLIARPFEPAFRFPMAGLATGAIVPLNRAMPVLARANHGPFRKSATEVQEIADSHLSRHCIKLRPAPGRHLKAPGHIEISFGGASPAPMGPNELTRGEVAPGYTHRLDALTSAWRGLTPTLGEVGG
jgi:hypothetical protein